MNRARALAIAILLALACGAAALGQELSQAEKDRATKYLESTKKGVLDATKGLSEAQWNFKAAPERWSIAQVMEHIAAAEDFLRGLDADQVMKAPAGDAGRDVKAL